uniref:hypothetical protein n=1 Tax=Bradyrhizobium sp. (strain ORS 278) TaxID=114615 RepID=UPI0012FF4CC7|nr:hypothetical protein [Bradyrhizobium sp. ORS 278]
MGATRGGLKDVQLSCFGRMERRDLLVFNAMITVEHMIGRPNWKAPWLRAELQTGSADHELNRKD